MSDAQWWVITGFLVAQTLFNVITIQRLGNMADWQCLQDRQIACKLEKE